MYTVELYIEEKKMKLSLRDESGLLAEESWVDDNDLLEVFFVKVGALLESNSLSVEDIDDFMLETENPTGYTTQRIAKTLIETLRFARKPGL